MKPITEQLAAAVRQQVERTKQFLKDAGYNSASVRERVAELAQRYGSPALDVGTGACACLALKMAKRGMTVTAVDHAASAVSLARERVAKEGNGRLEVRFAEAAELPFPDSAYRVVTAFDSLCHAADPVPVLKEMFRVCDRGGAVIITELNAAGRRVTQHKDVGFDEKLPALLTGYCQDCKQIGSPHHVTFVCERN